MVIHKYKFAKLFFILFFILYIVAIIGITQFPIYMNWYFKIDFRNADYNLVPFQIFIQQIKKLKIVYAYKHDIKEYLLPAAKTIFKSFGYNILLFCPMGLFLPALFKRCYTLTRVAIISFAFSICIEALQLLSRSMSLTYNRIFDIDDIIANVLGGLIGFGFYKIITILMKQYSKSKENVI